MKKLLLAYASVAWMLVYATAVVHAQATVQENVRTLKTYPFSDPDPVPRLGRIYPYFRFDGYTDIPVMKNWKFVELQNPYIKVSVTPEIGGKVWGAHLLTSPLLLAKERTVRRAGRGEVGFPFVYFNNVVKFRDVAMRGAWTSGGIEMNFGDIGHDPTVSTPVDYITRTNPDGSVSCFVGAWDWASRTRWTVEVNLPKDKAYFTTKSRWFNASPLDQTYYHWMNAGFKAAGNLEFVFPGSHYIGHGGDAHPWPKDKEGRNLNFYEQNNFGSYKSYHVLGKSTDFFGGYWHNDSVGFVRYSPHHEKLGQKVWVWGLSRQGMIWEKLLTDTDGQYVELQSGRLFNQAADESINSPFKHVAFQPYASDSWMEHWYPVRKTGGITAANAKIAMSLHKTATHWVWRFSPVEDMNARLLVKTEFKTLYDKFISLKTLQLLADSVAVSNEKISMYLDGVKIFDEFAESQNTNRPLETPADFDWNSEYGLYLKGKDLANQRKYAEAEEWLEKCLTKNPYHVPALGELAQLKYRQGGDVEALRLAKKALSVNTYDGLANYIVGLLMIPSASQDALSVAALSPPFRSAALTELTRMAVRENDFEKAEKIVQQALEHQANNDHAKLLQIAIWRKTNRQALALKATKELLHDDPLNHFARFEENLLQHKFDFYQFITNELPHEDFIEMAIWYRKAGLLEEALKLLEFAPKQVMCQLWKLQIEKEYKKKTKNEYLSISKEVIQVLQNDPSFVLPSRTEDWDLLRTISIGEPEVLVSSWQLRYYQGIALWQLGRIQEAKLHFKGCGNTPNFVPYYLAKAQLFKDQKDTVAAALTRAYALAPEDWRVVRALSNFYEANGEVDKALEINDKLAKKSNLTFHETYIVGQQRAHLLAKLGRYKECVESMKNLQILPNEGARGAHDLFREANIKYAIELTRQKKFKEALTYVQQAETWPENLGSGSPYDPDSRLTQFMKATLEAKMKKKGAIMPSKPTLNKEEASLLEAFME